MVIVLAGRVRFSRQRRASAKLFLIQIAGSAETGLQSLTAPKSVATADVKPITAHALFVVNFAAIAIDTPIATRRRTVVVVVVVVRAVHLRGRMDH